MTVSTQDAIAAFLAKGGAIKKVDATASCGMTDRQWHRASRDVETVTVIGRAYLPSNAMALFLANYAKELDSDRNFLYMFKLNYKALMSEFSKDAEPNIQKYDLALQRAMQSLLRDIGSWATQPYSDVTMENATYHLINRLYAAVGGSIRLF